MTPPPDRFFTPRLLACLKPPGGGDDAALVDDGDDALQCPQSGAVFPYVDGVPALFKPTQGDGADVTARIKSFYEDNPFPNYDGLEEYSELVRKGNENPFSANLLAAIGYNKLVLEIGCGTGQLSHYLQLNNNHVLGIDMSLSSLRLAADYKRANGLSRSAVAQMNIFNLALKDNMFDVVIAHGVLHHTYNAQLAFEQVLRKVKPGGIVMIGLYNSYARIMTWLRAKAIAVTGPNIDYVVRNRIRDARKAEIWIRDQYYNPHETWHSISEVLGWFSDTGVEFLNCVPAIMGSDSENAETFFSKTSPGTPYQRAVTQLSWIGTIAREGSLFDVIGCKTG